MEWVGFIVGCGDVVFLLIVMNDEVPMSMQRRLG
jgi:hypothetical protein